jgi:hypothetical protein
MSVALASGDEESGLLEVLKDELVHVLAVMVVLRDTDPDSSYWDDMREQVEHLQRMIAAIEQPPPDRVLH